MEFKALKYLILFFSTKNKFCILKVLSSSKSSLIMQGWRFEMYKSYVSVGEFNGKIEVDVFGKIFGEIEFDGCD